MHMSIFQANLRGIIVSIQELSVLVKILVFLVHNTIQQLQQLVKLLLVTLKKEVNVAVTVIV